MYNDNYERPPARPNVSINQTNHCFRDNNIQYNDATYI